MTGAFHEKIQNNFRALKLREGLRICTRGMHACVNLNRYVRFNCILIKNVCVFRWKGGKRQRNPPGRKIAFAFGLTSATKFAWQFLQLAFDLFLDSKTTLSWLRDKEPKEATDLDVKRRATMGTPQSGYEEWLCRCPYSKQALMTHLSCLSRINKHQRSFRTLLGE